MLVGQSNDDVEQLLHVLGVEELKDEVIDKDNGVGNNRDGNGKECKDKRRGHPLLSTLQYSKMFVCHKLRYVRRNLNSFPFEIVGSSKYNV